MKVAVRLKYETFLAEITGQEFAVFQTVLSKFRKVAEGHIREGDVNHLHPQGEVDLEIRVYPDALKVADYIPEQPAE